MAIFKIEQLSCAYDRNTALADITFELKQRAFVVLAGPSGCGKTTLLNAIAGFIPLKHGHIEIQHRRVETLAPNERGISMIFQDATLFEHLRVYENIIFGLRYAGIHTDEIQQRLLEVSRLLKIDNLLKRRSASLSGGEKQRVAIARALVHKPDVFLMDEALSALDARLKNELRMEMRQLYETSEATFLYVTHDQVEAMTLADILIIMNEGKIQQIGAPQQLYRSPDNLFVASFLGKYPMNQFNGYIQDDTLYYQNHVVPLVTHYENGNVILGVREQFLYLREDGEYLGSIHLIEDYGDERYYHIACEDRIFIMKGQYQDHIQLHDDITFSFHLRDALLFYEATKLRIYL